MPRYYNSNIQVQYANYNKARAAFPNISIPQGIDCPDIGLYIIYWPDPIPNPEPDHNLDFGDVIWDPDDEKYYQIFIQVPNVSN